MRPIDADALYTELVKMNGYGYLTAKKAIRRVKQSPTIDAVPVVRCKDCKFHYDRTQCKKRIGAWFDDDYCNGAVRAERKEE